MKLKNSITKLYQTEDEIISSFEFTEYGIQAEFGSTNKNKMIPYNSIEFFDINISVKDNFINSSNNDMSIQITLKLTSGKIFIIPITPGRIEEIYYIIDYKKCFNKFKLTVTGDKKFDIPIRIYSRFGVKLIGLYINSNTIFKQEFLCTIPLGIVIYFLTEMFLNRANGIDFSWLIYMLPLLIISIILTLPLIYQEYLKFRIRKALKR